MSSQRAVPVLSKENTEYLQENLFYCLGGVASQYLSSPERATEVLEVEQELNKARRYKRSLCSTDLPSLAWIGRCDNVILGVMVLVTCPIWTGIGIAGLCCKHDEGRSGCRRDATTGELIKTEPI